MIASRHQMRRSAPPLRPLLALLDSGTRVSFTAPPLPAQANQIAQEALSPATMFTGEFAGLTVTVSSPGEDARVHHDTTIIVTRDAAGVGAAGAAAGSPQHANVRLKFSADAAAALFRPMPPDNTVRCSDQHLPLSHVGPSLDASAALRVAVSTDDSLAHVCAHSNAQKRSTASPLSANPSESARKHRRCCSSHRGHTCPFNRAHGQLTVLTVSNGRAHVDFASRLVHASCLLPVGSAESALLVHALPCPFCVLVLVSQMLRYVLIMCLALATSQVVCVLSAMDTSPTTCVATVDLASGDRITLDFEKCRAGELR